MKREPRWLIPVLIAVVIALNVLYAESGGRKRALPTGPDPLNLVNFATPIREGGLKCT